MSNRFEAVLEAVRSTGTLTEAQRRDIRHIVHADGKLTLSEADTLFRIDEAVSLEACPEWPRLFIGAVTDFLVRQSAPVDHIDRSESLWLIQRISRDGRVRTPTEMELLLDILKHASGLPDSLEKFALDQVGHHVLGNGFVTAEDVEHLRRILHSCGSSGGVGISRMEARTLFEIADATASATNDESFTDLFVGALANHLMMSAAPPSLLSQESLRREYWLHQRGEIVCGVKRVFRATFRAPLHTQRDGLLGPTVEDHAHARLAPDDHAPDALAPHALDRAELVTGADARWLVDHLRRDHIVSEPERRLLAFLRDESPQIHDTLTVLIAKAA